VGRPAHLEVAWIPGKPDVALTNSCNKHQVAVGKSADCTATIVNNMTSDTTVHATLATNGSIVQVADVTGATSSTNHSWTFDGTLTPAPAPTVDDIVPGGTGFGYVSLASLGVDPLTDVGDETITNLTGFAPVLYGDESYSEIGMVSNGYAVLGGGDASDINFMPQTLPDAARPNNVLAPFWTDLNPEAGGLMYAAEVGDGTNNWVVLEWENVEVFSTGEPETFQIWLQEGTEANSFEYGTIVGDGDPAGLNVGAENRTGSSGVNLGSIPGDGDELMVLTSPPVGGGSATITYKAVGVSSGEQDLTVKMDSDLVKGKIVSRWQFSVR
jgi:hypothetical protein